MNHNHELVRKQDHGDTLENNRTRRFTFDGDSPPADTPPDDSEASISEECHTATATPEKDQNGALVTDPEIECAPEPGVDSLCIPDPDADVVFDHNGDVTTTTDDAGDYEEIPNLWPVIHQDAYYGLAGGFTQLVEPHTEADPIAVLVQFLIAFGNCTGRNAYQTVSATKHYSNLYCALVGPTSSARKGTSWDVIRWFYNQLRGEHESWLDLRVQTGLTTGEGLISRVRDETPKDSGIDDKRLLLIETEFARTLKAMNRKDSNLSDVLKQFWDWSKGQTLSRANPMLATDAHVSIVAHCTFADVEEYLTETDVGNGFANRFLWVCTKRSKRLPHGGDFTNLLPKPIARSFDSINPHPIESAFRDALDFANHVTAMTRDDRAVHLWESEYSALSEGRPGLLGAVLSRAEAQVLRLSGVYALLDCSNQIREEHLKAALALWKYCEDSARFIFGKSLGDPDADKILIALKSEPHGLTRSKIHTNIFRSKKTAAQLTEILTKLVSFGLLHQEKDASTGGRPSVRFFHGGRI